MLNKSEYLDFAPTQSGESVRINHDSPSCRGESKSMIVTRTEDGGVKAYCHRCGETGAWGNKSPLVKAHAHGYGAERHERAERKNAVPKDITHNWAEWTKPAREWLSKYGITEQESKRYSLGYSSTMNRVVLPTYDEDGLTGFITRKLSDSDNKPKYLTYSNDKSRMIVFTGEITNTLVLVEDMVSAIKVGRHTTAVPLLGTNLSMALRAEILRSSFNRFIIWLDHDNPTVIKKEIELHKVLSLYGDSEIIRSKKDPKEHSDKEIIQIINII